MSRRPRKGAIAAMNFPKPANTGQLVATIFTAVQCITALQRTFLHPSLAAFDAPSREECTVNRVNSNTPLQSLVLLNDPIYVEAAQVFAKRIGENGKTLNARLYLGFDQALNRTPDKVEREDSAV